jgi:LPS export ABC transporter protein LptC
MLLRIFTLCSLAALAIGTWILSTHSRSPQSRNSIVGQNMPGYYLKGTVLTDYDLAGDPSIKIAAERIQQLAPSTDVELLNVRLDYQSPAGQTWIMVGDKQVVVSGNVQLQGLDQGREGPATVRTEKLSYDVDSAEVHTDEDVKIMFGPHTLTGRGLLARLKEQTLRLKSRVNGRFTP